MKSETEKLETFWSIFLCIMVLTVVAIIGMTFIIADDGATPYDMNGDGEIDIVDVSIQINMLEQTIQYARLERGELVADVNRDGEITVADLSLAMQIEDVLAEKFGYE